MWRQLLKSKIHRAIVTEADLNYVGSLTLGHVLCDAADILPHELVHITNINTGVHWVTYVIRDADRPHVVCLNGTAARNFHPGDPVIIMAYGLVNLNEEPPPQTRVVFVDGKNTITRVMQGEHPFSYGPPD